MEIGIKVHRYSNLLANYGQDSIKTELSSIRLCNANYSVAAHRNTSIFVTGDDSYTRRYRTMVMRYTIKTDKWDTDLPHMKHGRAKHGICCLDNRH